jgi:hypothetical protein
MWVVDFKTMVWVDMPNGDLCGFVRVGPFHSYEAADEFRNGYPAFSSAECFFVGNAADLALGVPRAK